MNISFKRPARMRTASKKNEGIDIPNRCWTIPKEMPLVRVGRFILGDRLGSRDLSFSQEFATGFMNYDLLIDRYLQPLYSDFSFIFVLKIHLWSISPFYLNTFSRSFEIININFVGPRLESLSMMRLLVCLCSEGKCTYSTRLQWISFDQEWEFALARKYGIFHPPLVLRGKNKYTHLTPII